MAKTKRTRIAKGVREDIENRKEKINDALNTLLDLKWNIIDSGLYYEDHEKIALHCGRYQKLLERLREELLSDLRVAENILIRTYCTKN